MINYVICFLLILILYFNLFKSPLVKEGIDSQSNNNDKRIDADGPIGEAMYTRSGDLVDNCNPTNYKKVNNGKGAYACPTGNCFEVYGKDLFGKDGVPAPNQSKMTGKCCPYVYESKWDDLNVAYANKNTCDSCGYMYWNIDSSGDLANQPDIKQCYVDSNNGNNNNNRNNDVNNDGNNDGNNDVNDDVNDDGNNDGNDDKNKCCTPNNQLSSSSKNIIKLLVDTFLPSPEYTDIITTDDLVSAHKLENQTKITDKKINIIKQLNQLQDEMMPSDPITKFQHQIMGKLDVVSNQNTIGSPWKYPQTADGNIDTSTSRLSCVNDIGVGSSDNDKIIKRRDISLDNGPPGMDSSWIMYK